MYSVRVAHQKMGFSAAHFVKDADGCERLHGHNYRVEIVVEGPLNDLGMVIDFRELKDDARSICEKLDHRFLLPGDSSDIHISREGSHFRIETESNWYLIPMADCIILPIPATTVEYLSEHVARTLNLPEGLAIQVCVSESEGSVGCFRVPST